MTKDNHQLGKFTLDVPPMPRGTPQIEVTLDVDVNGILNVSAVEKSTGKANKIVITNDKGRLSKEDIERMINEAERNKNEDEAAKGKVEAKNQLEQLCYQYRQTLTEEKLKNKFTEEEKENITKLTDEALKWMSDNLAANKEEFEAKVKELESVFNPIMMRVYQAGGADTAGFGGFPDRNFTGNSNGSAQTNPDEVD